jgi:hypothetical protein
MQARFDKYQAITQQLPAPPALKKAIVEGTEKVAATNNITMKRRDLLVS